MERSSPGVGERRDAKGGGESKRCAGKFGAASQQGSSRRRKRDQNAGRCSHRLAGPQREKVARVGRAQPGGVQTRAVSGSMVRRGGARGARRGGVLSRPCVLGGRHCSHWSRAAWGWASASVDGEFVHHCWRRCLQAAPGVVRVHCLWSTHHLRCRSWSSVNLRSSIWL